jgi:hypothetical protein
MVSVSVWDGPGGALCGGAAVACGSSCENFADRGLASLPGGDESELVNGVRACSDAARPGYDILVLGGENMDEWLLERELSEPMPFRKSPRRCSWSIGLCDVFFLSSTSGDARAAVAVKAEARRGELTDESARCEPARRAACSAASCVSRGSNGMLELVTREAAVGARHIIWQQSLTAMCAPCPHLALCLYGCGAWDTAPIYSMRQQERDVWSSATRTPTHCVVARERLCCGHGRDERSGRR